MVRFWFALLLSSLVVVQAHASGLFCSLFRRESLPTYSKTELTVETLNGLVGTRVEVVSSWPGKKSVKEVGMVEAVFRSTRDNPNTVFVRIRRDIGAAITFEHGLGENSRDQLQIKVVEKSALPGFLKIAQANGQRVIQKDFFFQYNSFIAELRAIGKQAFQILYTAREQVRGNTQIMAHTATVAIAKLPTDNQILSAFIRREPPVLIIFSKNKKIELRTSDILALAYEGQD